jgi:SAM-dependent methyltransferase
MVYRSAWWLHRSKSPEYQEAYDTIAREFSAIRGQTTLESGCGNGENIRRMERGYVVGTDEALSMLQVASSNLKSYGISSRLVTSMPGKDELKTIFGSGTVLLLRDDYLNSKLPSSFADRVILTFPDLSESSFKDYILRNSEVKIFPKGTIPNVSKSPIPTSYLTSDGKVEKQSKPPRKVRRNRLDFEGIGFLAKIPLDFDSIRDREVHRILTSSGIYMLVGYALADGDEMVKKVEMDYMARTGLDKIFEMLSIKFIANQKIGADAKLRKMVPDEFKSRKLEEGYCITVYRKI